MVRIVLCGRLYKIYRFEFFLNIVHLWWLHMSTWKCQPVTLITRPPDSDCFSLHHMAEMVVLNVTELPELNCITIRRIESECGERAQVDISTFFEVHRFYNLCIFLFLQNHRLAHSLENSWNYRVFSITRFVNEIFN